MDPTYEWGVDDESDPDPGSMPPIPDRLLKLAREAHIEEWDKWVAEGDEPESQEDRAMYDLPSDTETENYSEEEEIRGCRKTIKLPLFSSDEDEDENSKMSCGKNLKMNFFIKYLKLV